MSRCCSSPAAVFKVFEKAAVCTPRGAKAERQHRSRIGTRQTSNNCIDTYLTAGAAGCETSSSCPRRSCKCEEDKTSTKQDRTGSRSPRHPNSEMDVAVGVRFPIEVTEISMDRNFGLDSASDNQSVVRDGGDCFRLMESGGWNPELVKPDKRADCDTATLSPSPRLVIRNNVDSVDSVDGADSAYGLDDNVSESSAELDSVIRTALWPPHETNHNFLPLDELERLITIKAVFQELRKHETFRQKPDDYLRGLANKVCRNSKVGSFITTRKKIFGTLLLITQIHAIERFIEDDLWDKDLPFSLERLNRNTKHSKNEMYREDKSPIRLFSTWTSHNCESFYLYQWKFLTPFFKMALTDNTRPLHYPLHKHHVLPFIENLENAGSDCEIMVSGGFSEVWRVKIHEAHYNCVPNSNPYFAVKRLRPQDDIMIKFKREVATLKRLSGQNHAHLMQLQLTYEWRGHYHLLFIWADGNLKDLWKSYPELSGPKSLPRNKELATWVSQQLLGLTKALQVIHQCPPDLQVDDNSEEGPDDTESRRTHGRHGDLKPENILWFRGTDSQEARLVISDFGLTQFHRRETGKLDPAKIARTPTYRPPEYDTGPKITQSFDIWTWGCVLLEFCVWYLKGYDEWDRFSKRRVVEHHGSFYKEDVYFNTGSPQPTCTATLKTSVIDVSINYKLTSLSSFGSNRANSAMQANCCS
ncbi:kinase-like domain-containing protein [Coniella lustricola]|uniref:Kinase-like domain-containing protein n=1 Tax=Coniella lustricola TaxID=2025994 RepID=A0A2T3A875_9PEZI|nr:kinase-like domain-containing protein [Coniella lustricola]